MKTEKIILYITVWLQLSLFAAGRSEQVIDRPKNVQYYNGQLLKAAVGGDLAAIKDAIANEADIETRDGFMNTALHLAARAGYLSIIDDLVVKLKADVNAENCRKVTPLHFAIINSRVDAIQKLVKFGANIEAQLENQNRPLHLAAYSGNVPVIIELIKLGAKVNAEGSNRNTPLHLATELGNIRAIQKLVELGAYMEAQNQYQMTPLHHAVIHGSIPVIIELIKLGAKVNAEGEGRCTPLHLASTIGRVAAMRELIKLGADIGAKHSNHGCAIHGAIYYKQILATSLLLTYNSPVDWLDQIASLLEIDHKFGALTSLVLKNASDEIKKLLSQPIDDNILNYQDASGTTALMYAIGRKQNEIVYAFIKYEDNFGGLNLFVENKNQQSALSLARDNKNYQIIGKLLSCFEDTNRLEKALSEITKFAVPLMNLTTQYLNTGYNIVEKNKYNKSLEI